MRTYTAVFTRVAHAEEYAERMTEPGMWAKDVVRKGRTVTFTEDLPDHALDESPGERWYSRAEMVGYYGSPPEGPVATLDGRRTPRSY